jgi:uncharacterized membrane protein SpoIIM required for sporulation
MKRILKQKGTWMVFVLLVAGFTAGYLGSLLGILVAYLWLNHGSTQQALIEAIGGKIWIPACGGGIGGAIGVWWGWRMVRIRENSIDERDRYD